MFVDRVSSLLLELKEIAIKNGDGVYGDLEQAIKDIEHCLESMDNSKISLLIAPTANLQDLSIDAGWQDEFLVLASRIDKLISIPIKDNWKEKKIISQLKNIENKIDIIEQQCKFYYFNNYVEIYQDIKKNIFSENIADNMKALKSSKDMLNIRAWESICNIYSKNSNNFIDEFNNFGEFYDFLIQLVNDIEEYCDILTLNETLENFGVK